jgi:hypothetical protein
VGNAAEHATAITAAMKDRMDPQPRRTVSQAWQTVG